VHERTEEPMNGFFSKFDTAGVWLKCVDHFISLGG